MTDMLMCLTESRDGWRGGGVAVKKEEEAEEEEGKKKKDADARRLPSSLPPATRPLRALADSRLVMKPGLTLPPTTHPSLFSSRVNNPPTALFAPSLSLFFDAFAPQTQVWLQPPQPDDSNGG